MSANVGSARRALTRVGTYCFAALLVCAMTHSAAAQTIVYSIGTVETIPGADIVVPVMVNTDSAINSGQMGFGYNQTILELTDIDLVPGALSGAASAELVSTDIDAASGNASVLFVLDSTAPYDLTIPVGATEVFQLEFSVAQGLLPGSEYEVEFASGFGSPQVTNVAFVGGTLIAPTLSSGLVQITNENFLVVEESTVFADTEDHSINLIGINTDPLNGFSLSLTFDPDYIQGVEVTADGTIVGMIGAEFFQPIIENGIGTMVLGVLMDLVPPFDGQVVPATGLAVPFARFVVDVLPEAKSVESVPIVWTNGLGTPPVDNVFVVGTEGVFPNLIDGAVNIEQQPEFIRGDADGSQHLDLVDGLRIALYVTDFWNGPICLAASDTNDDEVINIVDAQYLLLFLFAEGPPPAAPFPNVGVDGTPVYPPLPCDLGERP